MALHLAHHSKLRPGVRSLSGVPSAHRLPSSHQLRAGRSAGPDTRGARLHDPAARHLRRAGWRRFKFLSCIRHHPSVPALSIIRSPPSPAPSMALPAPRPRRHCVVCPQIPRPPLTTTHPSCTTRLAAHASPTHLLQLRPCTPPACATACNPWRPPCCVPRPRSLAPRSPLHLPFGSMPAPASPATHDPPRPQAPAARRASSHGRYPAPCTRRQAMCLRLLRGTLVVVAVD